MNFTVCPWCLEQRLAYGKYSVNTGGVTKSPWKQKTGDR